MENILVKFKDSEFMDELVEFTYDDEKYDYTKTMELARRVLYSSLGDYGTYEEYKEDYPTVLKELYDVAVDILDYGNYGVTTERFCDFMEEAFGWEVKYITPDSVFDVEYGRWSAD